MSFPNYFLNGYITENFQPTLSTSFSIYSLSFPANSLVDLSNYHLEATNSSTLTIGAGGLGAGGFSQTISAPVLLGASQTWTYTDAVSLVCNNSTTAGQIVTQGNTLTLAPQVAGAILTGVISGTGNVVIAGSGSITLSSADTYTGGTEVSPGATMSTTSGNALGAGPVAIDATGLLSIASGTGFRASQAGERHV